MPQKGPPQTSPAPAPRRPWTAPRVDDLPRLTNLTLQSTPLPGDCDPLNPSSCF